MENPDRRGELPPKNPKIPSLTHTFKAPVQPVSRNGGIKRSRDLKSKIEEKSTKKTGSRTQPKRPDSKASNKRSAKGSRSGARKPTQKSLKKSTSGISNSGNSSKNSSRIDTGTAGRTGTRKVTATPKGGISNTGRAIRKSGSRAGTLVDTSQTSLKNSRKGARTSTAVGTMGRIKSDNQLLNTNTSSFKKRPPKKTGYTLEKQDIFQNCLYLLQKNEVLDNELLFLDNLDDESEDEETISIDVTPISNVV